MNGPGNSFERPETGDGQGAASGVMRHDILRANTAVAVVLTAVLALALAAVFAGLRAARNQRRAEAAEAENQERLRLAYTEEARAIRVSAAAGGRAAAMEAISNAVAIRVSPDLRTEAMACLALADLVQEGPLVPTPRDLPAVLMDARLRYFVYGDNQGKVFINSLTDGRRLFALSATNLPGKMRLPAGELTFSPDGALLAAQFPDGTVVAWNLATRQPVFAQPGNGTNAVAPRILNGLEFSADSKELVFCDPSEQKQITAYNLVTGKMISTGVNTGGRSFHMRPDLRQVAVITETGVDILDYPAGTKRQTFVSPVPVVTANWSPDGKGLAIASEDGDVSMWEPEPNVQRHLVGHSEACTRLDFNGDGTLLFSSSRDGSTRLWDVTLNRMLAVGEGFGAVFTPDGRRIGFWKPWQGFGVWRVSTSSFFTVHECDKNAGPLMSIDLSPSGRWCVVTQNKGFRLWDLAGGDQETYEATAVSSVRMAMNETALFVCRTNGLESWPLSTNASGALAVSPAQAVKIPLPDGRGARAVALSRDGRWAAVELTDRRLARIDLNGNQPPVIFQGRWHTANLKGPASPTGAGRFAISPDGRWVATGFDFDGTGPRVWDANTGSLAAVLPEETSVTGFSADGRWLGLAGINGNSIWSVGDWRLQKEFARDEASLVHGALAFMPDASLLAVSSTRQLVQLRNWQSGEVVGDLIAPVAQSINSIRLSADGDTLVMATATDMVEVWRLGRLRQELAAMNLDWGAVPGDAAPAARPARPGSESGTAYALASLGGFTLVATLALVTLRWHRSAIKRFVIAEAQAAQSYRKLDLAKVELMHSQKMQALGTLATGIAHDFNNLLSVVRMSNKLIGRQTAGNAEIQELTGDIEQAVLQGKSVVGSVLGYARTGRGPGEPTDVCTVIEETVSLLSREFLSGISLTLELERHAPKVGIARGLLGQVLLNLLVNASEAMAGQGRLKITLRGQVSRLSSSYVLRPRPTREFVELSVLDSGPGIAPEIRDRVFEPFFTTKRSGLKPGTGLGLSLVYSIAESAGLGLGVESEPGRGARFIVIIPVERIPVRDRHSVKMPDTV